MIDLNGSWQTSPRLGVFFQVRNLFNVAEDRYQVDPSYVLSNMVVGTFYTFGVKGTF
jgi:outer membrane receptor protein involved in Fe transport